MRVTVKIVLAILAIVSVAGIVHYQNVVRSSNRNFDQNSLFQQDQFKNLRFAHRGGYHFGPENTIEAIVLNIREQKANAIEVDVAMTKDGVLVLFHDETIARILETDLDKNISDMTFSDIREFNLGDKRLGDVKVPRLIDALDTLFKVSAEKKVLIELDFKPHGDQAQLAVNNLLDILNDLDTKLPFNVYDRLFVSTFYPDALSELRKNSEALVLGLGIHSDSPGSKLAARIMIRLAHYFIKKYDVSILEPNHCMITDEFVDKWLDRKLRINTFTVNTECEKTIIDQYPIAYTTNCLNTDCHHDESELMVLKRNWCPDCKSKD